LYVHPPIAWLSFDCFNFQDLADIAALEGTDADALARLCELAQDVEDTIKTQPALARLSGVRMVTRFLLGLS
jgi:hypothetical protein